jgi:Coenzyme PQQ synthesis protein D (PqqD)
MSGLPPDTMFEIGGPNIVWEVFQDEVVVIDLDSGCYYALDPVGGVLFDLLVNGAAMSAIARTTANRYDGDPEVMVSEIERFAGRLLDAELLRERTDSPPVADVADETPIAKSPFGPPQFRVYTDMRDLLLLDPIHDTDETGWPVRRDPDSG